MSPVSALGQPLGQPPVPAPTSLIHLPYLREWRVKALLTQSALAKRAGVAAQTVTRAESGDRVSLLTAERLARALGVSVRQLQEEAPPEA
jgi:transcriptional regulator with XRE-family HTH domain